MRCKGCGQDKPPTGFYRDRAAGTGRASKCKACREVIRKQNEDVHRERRAATLKAWRQRNPEKQRASWKRWAQSNKDKITPSRVARRQVSRRPVLWADKKAMRSFYRIARAFRDMGFDVHVDHIVPLRAKEACGLHVQCNLALAHAKENLSKGSKLLDPPKISIVRAFRVAGIIRGHGLSGPSASDRRERARSSPGSS